MDRLTILFPTHLLKHPSHLRTVDYLRKFRHSSQEILRALSIYLYYPHIVLVGSKVIIEPIPPLRLLLIVLCHAIEARHHILDLAVTPTELLRLGHKVIASVFRREGNRISKKDLILPPHRSVKGPSPNAYPSKCPGGYSRSNGLLHPSIDEPAPLNGLSIY